jgi:hypothetical protein
MVQVERFLAETIPRQKQAAPIPDGQRPHAVEMFQAVLSPMGIGGQNDFGVTPGGETVPMTLQLGAQFGKVVDLAVEHDDAPLPILHGLMAARARVLDRQARMTKADGMTRAFPAHLHPPNPGVIRATMRDPRQRPLQRGAHIASTRPDQSHDSTHGRAPKRSGAPGRPCAAPPRANP